jgi:hypothetical protein
MFCGLGAKAPRPASHTGRARHPWRGYYFSIYLTILCNLLPLFEQNIHKDINDYRHLKLLKDE